MDYTFKASSRLCDFFLSLLMLLRKEWDNLKSDATQSKESKICVHVEVTCIFIFFN